MPHSSSEGKDWLAQRIWTSLGLAPRRYSAKPPYKRTAPRILDIGAGSGTYVDLLHRTDPRGRAHPFPHLTAVEVYGPYVDRFGLRRKYDDVIIGDACTIDLPQADVVILQAGFVCQGACRVVEAHCARTGLRCVRLDKACALGFERSLDEALSAAS